MKAATTFILVIISLSGFSQQENNPEKKGDFYVYWGWNRDWYSRSDINFQGADYNFTIKDVFAKDRQNKIGLDPYLNPVKVTIPQYNFRVGYFLSDTYEISIGMDHMKYVVPHNQTVKISGEIANSGTIYDGSYANDDIEILKDFLSFEHTDGLNYANVEFRRNDNLISFGKTNIGIIEGVGAGLLIPRTNTRLLNKERYDEFHLSGYGLSAVVGLNVNVYKSLFIQSEFKSGYINMSDIRTSQSEEDKASQHFFFYQWNILVGVMLHKKEN